MPSIRIIYAGFPLMLACTVRSFSFLASTAIFKKLKAEIAERVRSSIWLIGLLARQL
jgi:hypothetical protein